MNPENEMIFVAEDGVQDGAVKRAINIFSRALPKKEEELLAYKRLCVVITQDGSERKMPEKEPYLDRPFYFLSYGRLVVTDLYDNPSPVIFPFVRASALFSALGEGPVTKEDWDSVRKEYLESLSEDVRQRQTKPLTNKECLEFMFSIYPQLIDTDNPTQMSIYNVCVKYQHFVEEEIAKMEADLNKPVVPEPVAEPVAPPVAPIVEEAPVYRSGISYTSQTQLSNDELQALLQPLLLAAREKCSSMAKDGYNHYRCQLELNRDPYQLHHFFVNSTNGNRQEWSQTLGTNNLDAAVDIKIAIQSHFLNNGFLWLRQGSREGGVVAITTHDVMPYLEPEKVQISRSNGSCYLSFDARDRQNGDAIHFSMPLGIADAPESAEEISRRRDLVQEFLRNARENRQHVTKGEVIEYLASHSEHWFTPQHMPLPSYQNHTAITEQHGQRISLGGVMLHRDPSADSPSWLVELQLHLQPNLENSNIGSTIRSHTMRLHTDNQDLALERANYAVNELQTMLRKRQEPWAVLQGGTKLTPAASRELEQALAEMRHYEDDMGVLLRNQKSTEQGVDFTIGVMRCWRAAREKIDTSFLDSIVKLYFPTMRCILFGLRQGMMRCFWHNAWQCRATA